MCWTAGSARADFALPIANPVPKIISVPEGFPNQALESLAMVRHGLLNISTVGGNMLRDSTVSLLNQRLGERWKQISLQGPLNPVHVRQLKRIRALQVHYTFDRDGLSAEKAPTTIRRLVDLGPVRKTVRIPGDFAPQSLPSLRQLKFFVPSIQLGEQGLSANQIEAIHELGNRIKRFCLQSTISPKRVLDLTQFAPLSLRIQTRNNRLDADLLNVLSGFRGVEIILVVDGRLTVDDAKVWSVLNRFTLEVVIHSPGEMTPGLAGVLDRINPP